MSRFFLQAKHWQIFILQFVTAFIGMILYMIGMISSIKFVTTYTPNPYGGPPTISETMPFQFTAISIALFVIAGIFLLVSSFTQFGWMWAIGTKLGTYFSEETRKLNVKRFKIFFIYPLVYLPIVGIIIPLLIFSANGSSFNPALIGISFIFIILGHFFAMFCMIHTMYFVAKTYKSAIMQQEAHIGDYIGEFFGVWFFPIGIWILQPGVNKLVDQVKSSNTLDSSNAETYHQDDF
jgi:hypothetical protein